MYYPYKSTTIEFLLTTNHPAIVRISSLASRTPSQLEDEVQVWLNGLRELRTLYDRQGLTLTVHTSNGVFVIDDDILPLRDIVGRALHESRASGLHTVALVCPMNTDFAPEWLEEVLNGIKAAADSSLVGYDLLVQIIASDQSRELFISKVGTTFRDCV